MFHYHDLSTTLVADRRSRLEGTAGRRHVLNILGLRNHRRRSDRPTTVAEQAGAATVPIALGRTPNAIEHRAA